MKNSTFFIMLILISINHVSVAMKSNDFNPRATGKDKIIESSKHSRDLFGYREIDGVSSERITAFFNVLDALDAFDSDSASCTKVVSAMCQLKSYGIYNEGKRAEDFLKSNFHIIVGVAKHAYNVSKHIAFRKSSNDEFAYERYHKCNSTLTRDDALRQANINLAYIEQSLRELEARQYYPMSNAK